MADHPDEELVVTRSGESFLIRLASSQDEALVKALLERETADDIRYRFFISLREFDHRFLSELLALDGGRATSVIAIDPQDDGAVGLACLHQEGNVPRAEFAILVRSDLKGHGLGRLLMQRLIAMAHAKRFAKIEGFVLRENAAMQRFCQGLGFRLLAVPGDTSLISAVMSLTSPQDKAI